jgi:hypothetical protein
VTFTYKQFTRIEPWWNLNTGFTEEEWDIAQTRIEPWWNLNSHSAISQSQQEFTRIEPWWNLNLSACTVYPSLTFTRIEPWWNLNTISDGSIVLIDPTQKKLVDGKVYAIEIPYIRASIERFFIKYPNMVIKSDNPSIF